MPSGLDRPFPPENRVLWQRFSEYPGAVLVSEFPFGTAAASLTLRKRNKTIVGLALGVLIGQSSYKGGAMNAYRFAREQHKPTAAFAPDGTDSTSGNQAIIDDGGGTGFSASVPDEVAWGSWLKQLSSSI
ncbi:DNA recombination-mediator protein A [Kribbella sp. VKM Ac-2571]|nr:DNA recombination-mediator protein A [Kribbella sp. VKM Ac-2571]